MADQYAVIGNPIEHSRSPLIHQAFAQQTGQDMVYERILGDLEDFAGDARDFFQQGGRGLNITVPFKEKAFQMADELTDRARAAQAVNTLTRLKNGRVRGDNTDGAGLIRDLGCNHRFHFAGARVLLLGAGGASRGVLRPLLDEQPAQLVIANRTEAKALALADEVKGTGLVRGCGLDALKTLQSGRPQQFDIIINATAAGLDGEVPDIPTDCLAEGGWVYDMMYGPEPTAFVRWGQERGAAKALDGLGMLVEQAAESFFIWRGKMPDTLAVIEQLRTK